MFESFKKRVFPENSAKERGLPCTSIGLRSVFVGKHLYAFFPPKSTCQAHVTIDDAGELT